MRSIRLSHTTNRKKAGFATNDLLSFVLLPLERGKEGKKKENERERERKRRRERRKEKERKKEKERERETNPCLRDIRCIIRFFLP